ncbi:MAG: hypothetical protein M3384_01290 [Acidobacteriota bacterium]|nr:hypothetical protein [Acidobacteriota bacterium]
MILDLKRELLRHLVAALTFRARIAISGAPESFAAFRIEETVRTPAEILAHIGDLLEGSLYLMKGELVYLNSAPLVWKEEVRRFFAAAKNFDAFLASDAQMNQPVEKIVQGPIADALTHVGQIVMLRRVAGAPVQEESYFTAEIAPAEIHRVFFAPGADD